ncbi:cupin domain protein [Weissella oryzae SG25]|uniref:Cupin domain protein n=1 Tax=Weissella oryzae (strain DSM 25784 / JCM 18191 / LMG 30913 / SG25) TaxID=1329250 RepID=A0A069CSE7_WEIOS|nr:AraC family transcriptional regulator [Weissella oryzae]GAK30178.1 cupin domain protein [Weissella oryzae SG25]
MDTNQHEAIHANHDVLVRFFLSTTNQAGVFPLHWHQSIELIYVLSGEVIFTVNSESFSIKANQFFIIPSSVIHSDVHTANQAYVIQIPLRFFYNFGMNAENWRIDYNKLGDLDHQTVLRHFNHLYQIYQAKAPGYLFSFYSVLLILLEQIQVTCMLEKRAILTQKDQINDVIDYINVHFTEKITVNTLAATFGYNPNYLSRKFKTTTGYTLINYLYSLRVNRAYLMLIETDDSIKTIFQNVGLPNNQTTKQHITTLKNSLVKGLCN